MSALRPFFLAAALFILFIAPALLVAQGEAYYFATGGIDAGPSTCVDLWCGADMLPFTGDDLRLPARGNAGGTWGYSWIDSNGDGLLQDEEHIFVVIRRGDDDMFTFSTKSYPQYGVIAEGEDWIDYHEARNRGPSAADTGDPSAEGDDFEHNDRAGSGERGWEDASNYYSFNNARADQRGLGGSRYYFEHRNGQGLDEIEGFNKWLSFSNNKDDPSTAFNERGDCRNSYMRSKEAVTKGLLIPIADIPGLRDGDLDPLFGWYGGDMAAYVRDLLGPRLADPEVKIYADSSGCAQGGLPATHVMILQIECPIQINASGDCGDQATAEAQAAYWGITPTTPGQPPTNAVYRASHVLLFNDDMTNTGIGIPSFVLEPEDGVLRNLWVQDDFWRASTADVGRYGLGGGWMLADDSSYDHGCQERDKVFQLPAGGAGFFEAPLSRPLDAAAGAIYAVAEVGEILAQPGGGAGGNADPEVYQLILMHEGEVVAFAEVSNSGSTLALGGRLNANGLAIDPAELRDGRAGHIPRAAPDAAEFTRFVLRAGPGAVTLAQAHSTEFTPNDYSGMDGYEVLGTLPVGISREVTGVRFGASGGNPDVSPSADGFAVFANLEPDQRPLTFRRGDTNNDGKDDLSDAVFLLAHLFTGGPRWVCEEGADINNDTRQDLSDAVYLLGHLFLGNLAPPPPFPGCGTDPGGATCPASTCNG